MVSEVRPATGDRIGMEGGAEMKKRVIVPFVPDMGSVAPYVATDTWGESYRANALRALNSMREHDGLQPLTRMPAGTKYETTNRGLGK